MFTSNVYISVFLITGVASSVFTLWVRKKYTAKETRAFVYSFLSTGAWSFNSAARVHVESAEWTQLLLTTELLFVLMSAYFWYAFAEQYTSNKRKSTPRVIAVVYAIFIISLGLTNQYHNLVWSGIEPTVRQGGVFFEVRKGPGHYVFTLSSYAFYFVGIHYLFSLLNSARHIKGIGLVSISPMVLVGVNIFPYFTDTLITHETTIAPLGASGCLLFAGLAIEKRLLDIQPIARKKVLGNITDPLVVIDQNEKVVDYNNAFVRTFGEPMDAPRITEQYGYLSSQLDINNEQTTESTVHMHDGGKIFNAQIIPVKLGGEITGHTILLRDVTELKRSISEIERHNRHLQDFSDSAAHELRNPLALIEGYTETIIEKTEQDSINVDELHDHAETMYDSAERMNAILDDFLKTVRAAQSIEKTYEVKFDEIVETAKCNLETDERNVNVPVNGIIDADPQRLTLLIKTVLRFFNNTTSETGKINIELTENGFVIESSETKINSTLGNSLLQYGYTTKHDGRGLGLSIAKTLAETHYWDIEIQRDDGLLRVIISGANTKIKSKTTNNAPRLESEVSD